MGSERSTESPVFERALKAAIAAVIVAEVLDSARYRWHRAARAVAGWEDTVGHRQRMRRYDATVRSLGRAITRPG